MKLFTVTQAAEEIGCVRSTINRHCKARGIGRMVGSIRMLTATDVRTLKGLVQEGRGNPDFKKPRRRR